MEPISIILITAFILKRRKKKKQAQEDSRTLEDLHQAALEQEAESKIYKPITACKWCKEPYSGSRKCQRCGAPVVIHQTQS